MQALSRFTTTITSKSYQKHTPNKSWSIIEHTESSNTDAFGTLEFQGGNHAHKAQYCRVSYDANPKDIIHLMENIWKMETPKLIITLHGGMSDFNVQQKLGKVFREGLLKAAQTTGAWIITSGMDSGVVKHVAKALDDAGISARMRSKVVTIGIAPWGLLPLKDREHLIGKNIVVPYDHQSYSTKNRHTILNDRHSYFLLVDNGTVGRYGADMVLRKKFENYVSQEQKIGCGTRRVPIVCVVLEGGISTLGSILQYITSTPSCPVVVCDGSGRASDLLAFAQKNVSSKGGGSKASFLGMVEGNGEVKRKSAYMSREMSNSIEVHDFDFPYNDLTLWVILTKRHEMAKFLWQYGEEAMARALIAIRLYKGMAKVAANDYTAVEASTILRTYADDFQNLSIELLEHAYQISYADTAALLTTELPNWGHHTSLSLAFLANNKQFLSSPCCQILLAELWHGGLRFKSQPNFKVIAGVLFPPTILLLDFKSSGSNLTKTVGPLKQKEVRLDVLDNINNTDGEHEDDDHYIPNAKGLEKKRRSVISLTYNSLFNDSQFALKRLFNMRHKQESTNIRSIETGNESNEIFMNDKTGQSTSKIGKKQADVDYDFGRAEDVNACKTIQTWMIILFYRFLLFYRAPITSFWIWTISFLTFLMSFTYVLLVELELSPTALEWYIFFYVVAVGLEHLRKLVTLESSSMMEKIRVYYNTYWNILTAGAVITYLIGFFLRLNPLIMHSHGRVVLACNSTLWHMKLFDFLSVHPKIGPYIKMAAKMILNMSYILIMLLVTLMAFGLTKQSITYPHEKWNWILVRNIFFKPYFMLYGEVFATEIDPCGDESFNCVPGHLIPIVVMVIFLLVANILLINMLIAIFNNIFIQTNAMSQQIWAFQRYSQVLEYENTPIIPPPFTTLIHLYLVCRAIILYLFCKLPDQSNQSGFRRVREIMPFAIKVKNASYDQLRQIHDYEEDCVDDLCRKKNHLIKVDVEESMSTYADRLEMMTGKVMELMNENEGLKAHLIGVEDIMKSVGENQRCMMKLMLKNNRDRRVHERTSEADTESKVDSNYQLSPADLTSDAESDFDEILTRSRFNTSFRDNRTSTLPKLPHYTSITDGLASKLSIMTSEQVDDIKNLYNNLSQNPANFYGNQNYFAPNHAANFDNQFNSNAFNPAWFQSFALKNELNTLKESDTTKSNSFSSSYSPSSLDSNSPRNSDYAKMKYSATRSSKKKPTPVQPQDKDASYYERRKKNNESARRSREQRRIKEESNQTIIDNLQRELEHSRGFILELQRKLFEATGNMGIYSSIPQNAFMMPPQ
uniref:LSDAT_euk domain-containing protein n=1 Tax=Rhabditophanes sp. KR3021 TaxID=114890 RepID=A0AC35U1S2_9BILA